MLISLRSLVRVPFVALFALLACMPTHQAFGHPLGSGLINRYARLDQYRDVVRLTYVLDYGWQATADILVAGDTNHDRKLSTDELQALADAIQTNYGYALRLHLGASLVEFDNRSAGIVQRPDVNGFPTIKLTLVYDAKVPAGLLGSVDAEFEDLNFEDNVVWKEMTVYGSSGAVVQVPEEFTHEISEQLDAYPPLNLVTVPDQDKANWSWQAGTGDLAPTVQSASPPMPIDLYGADSGPLPKRSNPPEPQGGGGLGINWWSVGLIGSAFIVLGVARWALQSAIRRRRSGDGGRRV